MSQTSTSSQSTQSSASRNPSRISVLRTEAMALRTARADDSGFQRIVGGPGVVRPRCCKTLDPGEVRPHARGSRKSKAAARGCHQKCCRPRNRQGRNPVARPVQRVSISAQCRSREAGRRRARGDEDGDLRGCRGDHAVAVRRAGTCRGRRRLQRPRSRSASGVGPAAPAPARSLPFHPAHPCVVARRAETSFRPSCGADSRKNRRGRHMSDPEALCGRRRPARRGRRN